MGCADCHIQLRFSTTGGLYGRVIISAWYADRANRVDLIADESRDQWILRQVANGTRVAAGKTRRPIAPDQAYAVQLDDDGSNLVLTVDGEVILTVPSGFAPSSGTIRIKLRYTSAAFEQIEVS